VGNYGTYDERVRRGIVVLNAYDTAWRDRVDATRLDLHSIYYCVIGQVFDHLTFREGVERLSGLDQRDGEYDDEYDARVHDWTAEHGFDVDSSGDDTYEELTAAWRATLGAPTTEEESE
jgi:hypothetical protein